MTNRQDSFDATEPPTDASKGKYWFELFEHPNTLMSKVSTGCGMTPQEMLAKAQVVIESLHEDFANELRFAIEKLEATQSQLAAANGDVRTHIDSLFRIAHEVKGQGKTFGFDLVSSIGESLCALLDRVDPSNPKLAQATKTHIDALQLVRSRGLQGDGGDMGATLVTSLWKEVEVVGGAARPPPRLTGGNRDGLDTQH